MADLLEVRPCPQCGTAVTATGNLSAEEPQGPEFLWGSCPVCAVNVPVRNPRVPASGPFPPLSPGVIASNNPPIEPEPDKPPYVAPIIDFDPIPASEPLETADA